MITIEQEEKIRSLLPWKMSDSQIAIKVGVNRKAVMLVRKTLNLINDIPEKERQEIQRLLLAGVPIGAIEIKTLTPRNKIIAMRGYYYLQKRKYGWRKGKCPTCGAIMLPDKYTHNNNYNHKCPEIISKMGVQNLYHVVSDITELNNLRIIPHPLFCDLAQRAEQTLEKINVKETNIC